MDAFYEPAGDGFASTAYTRGPWDPRHQHAGPPAALLARAAIRESAIEHGRTARCSFDILRPVPIAPLAIDTRVLRPGRRVEQLEATLRDEAGEALMRLTCWRLRAEAVALPAGLAEPDPPPAPPESGHVPSLSFWRDEIAYHRALEWRGVAGSFDEPGAATAWTRMRVALVAGEAPTPLERLLVMADAASGLSAALPWDRWIFVNVDLGVHLEREPEGEWLAMDARTRFGPEGAGLCTSVLSDARGRVGVTTQSLLVGPRTPPPSAPA